MKLTKLFTHSIFLKYWDFSELITLKYIRSNSEKVVHDNQNQAHKSGIKYTQPFIQTDVSTVQCR